jgi:FkbM family methyltransferase
MPIVLQLKSSLDVDFDFIVHHEIFRNGGKFHFVQIGANDGISRPDDLIRFVRQYDATGIMVEPQPDLFKQLSNNMKDYPNIELINAAIHKNAKSMTLYRFDPETIQKNSDFPLWAKTNGIASFDRDHVAKHARRIGLSEDKIDSQQVPCLSMNELLARSQRVPDILKVDTEGYDYELITMLDLTQWRPTIIRFEYLHMSKIQYDDLICRLFNAGYRFLVEKQNTTAYLMTST